jgi:hypothetical protein|tara:strand:- start:344 stop:1015 length:672 start_codon:yes stop_codon:yes gene_type:complete
MTIKFWMQDLSVLINKDYIFELWPMSFMTYNQKLNALSRIIIILSLIGGLVFRSVKAITTGLVVLFLIALLKAGSISNLTEGFTDIEDNIDVMNKENQEEIEDMQKKINEYKKPTVNNPLGNVLLTDIQDNPQRKAAPPSFYENVHDDINNKTKEMIKEINKNNVDIEKKLFQDLGNNTAFDYSMRNFYSTANTEIPSDQKSFTEYLYGDMKSTKDGTLLKPR